MNRVSCRAEVFSACWSSQEIEPCLSMQLLPSHLFSDAIFFGFWAPTVGDISQHDLILAEVYTVTLDHPLSRNYDPLNTLCSYWVSNKGKQLEACTCSGNRFLRACIARFCASEAN